jgi:hypothetical protein
MSDAVFIKIHFTTNGPTTWSDIIATASGWQALKTAKLPRPARGPFAVINTGNQD